MLNEEIKDSIENSIFICDMHFQRLEWALNQITGSLPFSVETYLELKPEQIAVIDQFVFRFAKAQDNIGNKLFRLILTALDEDIEGIPFRDILNKLEKLSIISNRDLWISLREIRNELAHEYSASIDETIVALNKLFNSYSSLKEIYNNCLSFIKIKFYENT